MVTVNEDSGLGSEKQQIYRRFQPERFWSDISGEQNVLDVKTMCAFAFNVSSLLSNLLMF